MDGRGLLETITHLLEEHDGDLACPRPGHRAGHVCVLAGDLGTALPDDTLTARYPRVYWRGDPPIDLPTDHDWDSAWARGARAVACGQDDTGRLVVAVGRRTVPEPVPPAKGLSWTERLTAMIAKPARPVPAPDWTAIEARLGTRLPADYKQLVDTYGCDGLFDGFFHVFSAATLVDRAEYLAGDDMMFDVDHPMFPAPGGLLGWADNEHHENYFWITDGPDPDRWPVYALDSLDEGGRFDCTATEFLYRQMTEQTHPFHTATEGRAGHWFQPDP